MSQFDSKSLKLLFKCSFFVLAANIGGAFVGIALGLEPEMVTLLGFCIILAGWGIISATVDMKIGCLSVLMVIIINVIATLLLSGTIY